MRCTVLQLQDKVIDESLDIVNWALNSQDPNGLLKTDLNKAYALIEQNDNEFKYWLDRYKYFVRHPENTQLEYRLKCENFLQILEDLLVNNKFLLGKDISIADIAIMPFIRQFANVNKDDFYNLPYPLLQKWLNQWLEHPLFLIAMTKYKLWQKNDNITLFPKDN